MKENGTQRMVCGPRNAFRIMKNVAEKQRIRKVKILQVEGTPLSTLRIKQLMACTWRTGILMQ